MKEERMAILRMLEKGKQKYGSDIIRLANEIAEEE